MRAGKLRRRASLQRKSITQDSFGAEIASWAEFAAVWAAVEPLQGREFWNSQAEQSELTTRIRIRYRDDVRTDDRVVWGSRTYDIEAAAPNERMTELELMCRELVE